MCKSPPNPPRLLPCAAARPGLPVLLGSYARGPGTHRGLAAPRGCCLAGRKWGTSLDILGLPLNWSNWSPDWNPRKEAGGGRRVCRVRGHRQAGARSPLVQRRRFWTPGAHAPCSVSRALLRACAIPRPPPLHPSACVHACLRSSSSVGVLLKLCLPLVSMWAQRAASRRQVKAPAGGARAQAPARSPCLGEPVGMVPPRKG